MLNIPTERNVRGSEEGQSFLDHVHTGGQHVTTSPGKRLELGDVASQRVADVSVTIMGARI